MSPRTIFLLCAALVTASLPLAAQPVIRPAPPKVVLPVQDKVDWTSPAATIRSFAASLNRYDFAEMMQGVADGKPGALGEVGPMVDQFKKIKVQILISEPRIHVQGNWASASFFSQVKVQMQQNNAPVEQTVEPERVLLRLSNGQWKIVGKTKIMIGEEPMAPEGMLGMEPGEGFLTMIATFLANPNALNRSMQEGHQATCAGKLKQLAVAAIEMQQDFDKTFAFAKAAEKATLDENRKALLAQHWQKALYPYTAKDLEVFFCSLRVELGNETPENAAKRARQDKVMADLGMGKTGEPYALNENLIDLKYADILKPSQTVLFYDGAGGKLNFLHDGKANIAFCDGRVQAFSPDGVQNLIWNPKGK